MAEPAVALRDLTDRYRLVEEIGRGSIGIVYRAVDQVLHRAVAVKVLRPELLDHGRHRPRFLREGLIGGRLGHPNIVPVFEVGQIDVGEVRAAPCLVMGLLAGRSLRTIIRSGRISIQRQLGWFTQDQFGPEFGAQVAALQDGQVSQPFKTQAGWHIVQREGSRQTQVTDQNRRAQMREQIGQRKLEEEWDRYLRELRGDAYVDIRLPGADATMPASGG